MKKLEKYTAAEMAQLKKGTRKNFTTGDRHKMCLSQETLEGLRMTGIIIASYKVLFFGAPCSQLLRSNGTVPIVPTKTSRN